MSIAQYFKCVDSHSVKQQFKMFTCFYYGLVEDLLPIVEKYQSFDFVKTIHICRRFPSSRKYSAILLVRTASPTDCSNFEYINIYVTPSDDDHILKNYSKFPFIQMYSNKPA